MNVRVFCSKRKAEDDMEDKGEYFEYAGTRIDKKRILELPAQAATFVSQVFFDLGNKTEHLNRFQFRSTLVSLVPVWLLLYGVIFCVGIVLNCKLLHWIYSITRGSKVCVAHVFLFRLFTGNSLNDLLIKDVIVLPVSFSTLTGVHWILGGNFCKFFPIIQDSCFYSSSLILLCGFVMRFRQVSHSSFHSGTQVIEYPKSIRHHSSLAVLLICFGIALCAIIPHTVYIEFVDLGYFFGQPFHGSGVCYVRRNHIMDYVKYLFIIFYVVPVCLSLSYHFKTSDIIEKWEESSDTFAKTKRLTIHRGSLIETSSFINTGRGSTSEDKTSEPRVQIEDKFTVAAEAPNEKTQLTSHRQKPSNRSLRFQTEDSSGERIVGRREMLQRTQQDVTQGLAHNSSLVRQTHNSSLRVNRPPSEDSGHEFPGYRRTTTSGVTSETRVTQVVTVPLCPPPTTRITLSSHEETMDPGSQTVIEFEESHRRRNTINFYPATTTITSYPASTSLMAPNSPSYSRRSSDRSEDLNSQTNRMTGRQSFAQPEDRTRRRTREYESRDPDIVIRCNPSEGLPDVRIDDVLNSLKIENSDPETEDEEDGESENGLLMRTSLDLENVMQRTMSRILLFHSLLLLPFNILRFVKHLMPDWDKELSLDIAFLTLVALTFSTILVVPIVVLRSCVPAYEDGLQRFLRDEDRRAMNPEPNS